MPNKQLDGGFQLAVYCDWSTRYIIIISLFSRNKQCDRVQEMLLFYGKKEMEIGVGFGANQ